MATNHTAERTRSARPGTLIAARVRAAAAELTRATAECDRVTAYYGPAEHPAVEAAWRRQLSAWGELAEAEDEQWRHDRDVVCRGTRAGSAFPPVWRDRTPRPAVRRPRTRGAGRPAGRSASRSASCAGSSGDDPDPSGSSEPASARDHQHRPTIGGAL